MFLTKYGSGFVISIFYNRRIIPPLKVAYLINYYACSFCEGLLIVIVITVELYYSWLKMKLKFILIILWCFLFLFYERLKRCVHACLNVCACKSTAPFILIRGHILCNKSLVVWESHNCYVLVSLLWIYTCDISVASC